MKTGSILTTRIANMGLNNHKFTSVSELLRKFGAVQCQDLNAGKWALGLRIKNATLQTIDQMLADENIVRTHVLRPTWHYVHKEDVRWMLELTAPRILQTIASYYKRREVTEEMCIKTRSTLKSLLEGNRECTHAEVQSELKKAQIPADGIRLQLLLMDAEIHQIICNGTDKENSTTYAFFDDRIPMQQPLSEKEATEELVRRFISSHGPATIQDCARWAGLTIGMIKEAVKDIQERKEDELKDEGEYLYMNDIQEENLEESNYLLPRYDEYFNGYKDKSLFLPNYGTKNEILLGFNQIIAKGQIVGKWTRIVTKKNISMEYEYYGKNTENIKEIETEKAQEYALFLGKELT